ncbi:hypothetical protein PRIPAC_78427 [Pristionchus pacificus]|uniref:Uncharacterized protein n=1 Tax=Pristionchus pacificus TaxID=54126 RepID=A0A2A6BHG2_PRIPA|nr:hypothetical protein PRIPAC_78427 [Pristionchus pacificus]|eukprot:PDM65317.1 hypothetical protein PRIPAC_52259 [Pristionchus pacificus]
MATHQTTKEHHHHMFTYLGGFVLAFIFFFAFIRIWHYCDKKKVCCKRRQVSSSIQTDDPTVVYRPTTGAVHIAMEALGRRDLITHQPVFGGNEVEEMEMEDEVKKEETQKNTRQCVETIVPSNSSDDVDGTAAGTSQTPVEVHGEGSLLEGIENVGFLGYVDCPKIAKKCVDEYKE